MDTYSLIDNQNVQTLLHRYVDGLFFNMVGKHPNMPSYHTETFQFDGKEIVITIQMDRVAEAMLRGRNKGRRPPTDAIKAWITKKNIIPRQGKNGKIPTTNQLAFLIARSIGENGTGQFNPNGFYTPPTPRRWIEEASDEIWGSFRFALENAIARDMERSVALESGGLIEFV